MNIINKLRDKKIDIEIEAAISLPIINSHEEMIFAYYTKPNKSKDSFLMDKIKCIYTLPYNSDEIVMKSPEEYFDKALLEKVSGAIIKPLITGEAAIEKEDSCISMYNDVISLIEKNGIDEDNSRRISEYKDNVLSIFSDSTLKDLYIYSFEK